MGFCVDGDDQYDVFLSYAHADDVVHNRWVGDFEQYLKETVIAELKCSDEVYSEDTSLFRICRDETGFPEGGELKEVIYKKVSQSQFLLIFLGKGYLKSSWCLSELDIFRNNTGGTIRGALERCYFIVLDNKVLDRLREGNVPEQLPPNRNRLWKNLRDITQRSIRKEDFLLSNGDLLPVYQTSNHAHPDFHKACTPLVKELASRLIEYRRNLRSEPPRPRQLREDKRIAIGAVPERLEAARDELIEAMQGTEVLVIEKADLERPSEETHKRLKSAKLLVQPFDHFEPIVVRGVGDPRGGHLAVQKKLFEKCHGGEAPVSDVSIIWWEPLGLVPSDAAKINDYDKVFIDDLDKLPEEQKRRCSARELATELFAREKKPLVTARVWIECEESHEKTIVEAKHIVRNYFDTYCRQKEAQHIQLNAALKFGVADWSILERKLKRKPDGVVIVYDQNKDIDALMQQEEKISDLEEVFMGKMFPGIFYMRPKGTFWPSEEWRVVRFTLHDHNLRYKPEELQEFVSKLFEVLYNKYR